MWMRFDGELGKQEKIEERPTHGNRRDSRNGAPWIWS